MESNENKPLEALPEGQKLDLSGNRQAGDNLLKNDPLLVYFMMFLIQYVTGVHKQTRGMEAPPEYVQGMADCVKALDEMGYLNRSKVDNDTVIRRDREHGLPTPTEELEFADQQQQQQDKDIANAN